MKKLVLIVVLIFGFVQANATHQQDSVYHYRLLLTGASFASSHNSWFEIGCRHLNAQPINRAVGGEAIVNAANRMVEGTLYSFEELDQIDALVIMHVHDRDVFRESALLPDYRDYPTPLTRDNYAIAYDYVIKRYLTECYELRNNPKSRYYGSEIGKPAVIVLCTHWHDDREVFNLSVRKLAEKWGFPLVEFDKNIGFSKNVLHPVTGEQPSLLYAKDSRTADGVKYGWHPKRGEHEFIQQRMAAIFVDLMKKVLPIK